MQYLCSVSRSRGETMNNFLSLRNNWTTNEIKSLFELPFLELLFQAQQLHHHFFPKKEVQRSQLLSIKTGACPEDCGYCSQSAHYKTELQKQSLMEVEDIVNIAQQAKEKGVSRFCMGAAWRSPPMKAFPNLVTIIQKIKALGLETCMTLGMLTENQAQILFEAGLDFYNHNLDTSPNYYPKIVRTHTFSDRLETLKNVRKAGLKVCCGGIVGMGETREDRIELLKNLATLDPHPESVPINLLVPMKGTPLEETAPLDPLEFVRCIAVSRLLMPRSMVRLSAGRKTMSEELQMLCFLAGANSIHYGEKLLTTENQSISKDDAFFKKIQVA